MISKKTNAGTRSKAKKTAAQILKERRKIRGDLGSDRDVMFTPKVPGRVFRWVNDELKSGRNRVNRLKELGLLSLFWTIEMPLVPVISDMELYGIMVSSQVLNELGGIFDEKISTLREALDYWSGTTSVNFNSPDQVANIFFDKLKFFIFKPKLT